MKYAVLISAGLTAMAIGILGSTGVFSGPLLFISALIIFVLQTIVIYSIIKNKKE